MNVLSFSMSTCVLCACQENMNLLVDRSAYSPQTQQAMSGLSEREISFELIEVCRVGPVLV